MMRRLKQGAAIVALASVFAVPTITQADSHEQELTGVYKERHDLMKANGGSAKAVYGMIAGEMEFDLEKAKAAGATVVENSGDSLLAVFPPGTNEAPSKSLDSIWTDWDGFTALAHKLTEKAQALADAEDQATVAAAFGEMGKVCGSCHDKYQVEEEE